MALLVKCFPWGALVRLTAVFTKPDDDPDDPGGAVDPDTVKVRTRDPLNAFAAYLYLTDVAVIRDEKGKYRCDVDVEVPGEWTYRWEGTGVGQSAGEGKFKVADSVFIGGSP